MSWEERFLKTWLAWPQFDIRDHQLCPILDQVNTERPINFLEKTELLPYTSETTQNIQPQSLVQRWSFAMGEIQIPPTDKVQRWTMQE